MAGLSRPDDGRIVSSGTVLFDRAAGIDLPPQRRRIGYVPQDYALFPHMTVEENVAYGVRHATREVASFLGLENLLPVERLQRCGDQFRLVVAGRAVTLPATCLEALAAADPDPESPIAPLFVYVPPDEPEIDRAGNGAAARDVGRLRWPARIEELRSEGPLVLLRLRLSCREACGPTGRAPLPTPPAAGIGLPGDQEVGPELEVARSKRYLRQARLQIGDAVEVSVRPESLRLLGSSRRGR